MSSLPSWVTGPAALSAWPVCLHPLRAEQPLRRAARASDRLVSQGAEPIYDPVREARSFME